ncbi:MAG: hypothetical protein RI885_2719 [Actinomycetota bacterium]
MTDAGSDRPRWDGTRLRRTSAIILTGVILLIGGIAVGRATAPTPPLIPSTTSADAGFARDMQTHHTQAVEMSMIIYAKTDDDSLRTLSYDIATSQSQQAGQMFGWLSTWGLRQASPEPSMTWMTRPALSGSGHDHGADGMTHTPGEAMPGLATDEQITSLEDATGTDADRIFLELMIAHHLGGVEMAEAVLDRTDTRVVRSLATGVVTAQQGEITYMRGLLTGL